MGGTVAVTIRRQDGEVIKMARKTGSYGYMLSSKEFNTGEFDTAVDNYVSIFNEMKEDYQSGEPYKHPMSPVYGWCESLAPCGYGLVVIDLQNKKIQSMQGYDNPGRLHAIEFSYQSEERSKDYDFLLTENKLLVYERDEFIGKVHDVLGSDISPEKIQELIKASYNPVNSLLIKLKLKDPNNIGMLEFLPESLKDFEIINYNESIEDLIKFAKNITHDGFTLSQEEVSEWLDFADNLMEDLELDEDLPQEDYDTQLEALSQSYKAKLAKALKSKKLKP